MSGASNRQSGAIILYHPQPLPVACDRMPVLVAQSSLG